ncbi:mitochondrial inner membrane protein [Platysternon megacephalum]|uniref:Mitochondrial inner membrane protein n=1 Tax=Platysternon megacephalum TaxID=55544 RepID=A0A4D9EUE3_9SAUR|nr:mitochondrial inner membrane protein [Platysternon megacephalum]
MAWKSRTGGQATYCGSGPASTHSGCINRPFLSRKPSAPCTWTLTAGARGCGLLLALQNQHSTGWTLLLLGHQQNSSLSAIPEPSSNTQGSPEGNRGFNEAQPGQQNLSYVGVLAHETEKGQQGAQTRGAGSVGSSVRSGPLCVGPSTHRVEPAPASESSQARDTPDSAGRSKGRAQGHSADLWHLMHLAVARNGSKIPCKAHLGPCHAWPRS